VSFFSNFSTNSIKTSYKKGFSPWPFLFATLFYGLTFGITKGIMDNYLAEVLNVREFSLGIIEAVREVPGLFLIFILAFLYRNSSKKNFQLALGIAIVGLIGLVCTKPVRWVIVFFLFILSVGDHITLQVRQSLSIEMSAEGQSGKAIGIMTSFRSLGRIFGYFIIPFVFFILSHFNLGRKDATSYKALYAVSFVFTVIAFLFASRIQYQGEKSVRKNTGIYFNKKFNKYYTLQFFYGARKQVFITFAPFVLVLEYGASASVMALLFAISAICVLIFSPILGRLIDYVGYKKIMVADTLILIIVCFFYGFSQHLFAPKTAFIVVCANYVFDSILSLCSMASLVYVKDLASNQDEVNRTITSGISVNHFISILIALFGGLLWKVAGIEILFTLSALLGLINSIIASTIQPIHKVTH